MQNLVTEHFSTASMFEKEGRNIEHYFWKQQTNFMQAIEMRGAKAAQQARDEMTPGDWTFDKNSRSWSNKTGEFFMLEKTESTTKALLTEKVMAKAAKDRVPTDEQVHKHLNELVSCKNAM